ncbi:MAG: transporter substrate-binding domain-containing protein [Lachnospiraceae bacterium]|nr:transporter substrate-binding domain-containing protein [Lachnospiraceae bacterium]
MKRRIWKTFLALACLVSVLTGCVGSGSNASRLTAKVIDADLTKEEYAFAVDPKQPDLLDEVNAYVAKIKSDGTYDAICERYFGNGKPKPVVPAAEDDSKDQLFVATNATFAPFEYVQGDEYYGIDMEIAAGLAEYLGKELVIRNMDFETVLFSVNGGESDIAMSALTVTEERKELVSFSDSYYAASQRLVVRSDNKEFKDGMDAASVEAILKGKDSSVKVGVENETTSQLYCEGDAGSGYEGFSMTVVGYSNGSLAVQDLLNGNVDYVIIDAAPAKFITEKINELQ